MKKLDRLEEARKAYKWWEAVELGKGLNWRKLEHAGINFAPAYIPHHVPMKYNGAIVTLNHEQEELASFYAAMPDDGPQLGNPKTRPVFQKNFFKEFKEAFPSGHVVQKFDLCDFSLIKEHLDLQKSLKKAATEEEKAANKAVKEAVQLKYGYALIDGRMEKVRSD
jgi:DNA topoisomerase-1